VCLTPEEFRDAFANDGIATFLSEAVSSLPIGIEDADWLTNVGLPRSAAPFLSFGSNHEINIPTLKELWGVSDGSRYRVIGSNGSGDPIAIDTEANGAIVYLNHDNAFQRVFINSSVTKLAEVVLAYRQLIVEALAAGGPEAYLDGKVPPESLQRFVSIVTTLDPPAIESGMWVEEIEELQGRAETG